MLHGAWGWSRGGVDGVVRDQARLRGRRRRGGKPGRCASPCGPGRGCGHDCVWEGKTELAHLRLSGVLSERLKFYTVIAFVQACRNHDVEAPPAWQVFPSRWGQACGATCG
ncbi:protein of unknown function [Thauera humireducens]|nr:protein of unknown function [Thauera humireducens]